jgi:fumarate reductase subunit C
MLNLLKDKLDIWLLVLTAILIPVISFSLGLNFRVEALEKDNVDFKTFIKVYNEQRMTDTQTLSGMKQSLDLITGYFRLTPKDK